MSSLTILDVGHGNCAVLSGASTVVIDAATKGTLLELLEQRGVTRVAAMLLSHADEDHIAGAPSLLLDPGIVVERVYFNTDSGRQDSRSWTAFLVACTVARTTKGTRVIPHLTSSLGDEIRCNGMTVEIVSPPPETAGAGPGSRDERGQAITANSMSGAVRVTEKGRGLALLCGDIGASALDVWDREDIDVSAEVLVFPHHGGLIPGTTAGEFTARLCARVRPNSVVFSIGRGRHGTPRPEVVEAVRSANPDIRILCTQLSRHCAATPPSNEPSHLAPEPARGRRQRHCCAGTAVIELGEEIAFVPSSAGHQQFISDSAPTALCRRSGGTLPLFS